MTQTHFAGVTRVQRKFLSVIIAGCVGFAWLLLSRGSEYQSEAIYANQALSAVGKDTTVNKKIVILMWTKFFSFEGDRLMDLILSGRKWNKSCCSGEVEVTLDKTQLSRATAIVFYCNSQLKTIDLPPTRRTDQLWVLYVMEGPYRTPLLSPYNNLFNWTMTYRSDSDIVAPYGESIQQKTAVPEDKQKINGIPLVKWITGKTNLMTGVISHCPTSSKREEYIKLLQNSIPVDIYGRCGTKSVCSRFNNECDHDAWWTKIASKYKFYFAAENAFCEDYITEKFWRALQLGMVPVVYGGGNYTKVAPPNSYIDVRDFPSHKELAQYLLYLNRNDEEYRKYFSWRRNYNVRMAETWQGWCDLCRDALGFRRRVDENAQTDSLSSLSRVYSDLERWWSHKPFPEDKENACSNPDLK